MTADNLRIHAATGIGETSNPLDIEVGTLSAVVVAGDVAVSESDDLIIGTLSVTTQHIDVEGAATDVTDVAQSGVRSESGGSVQIGTGADLTLADDVSTGDGDIDVTVGGSLVVAASATVTSTAGSTTVGVVGDASFDGDVVATDGHIRVNAGGAYDQAGDLSANGATASPVTVSAAGIDVTGTIDSEGGDVGLNAAGAAVLGGDIRTAGGDVSVLAATGAVTMADGIEISSSGGNIRIEANTDLALSAVNALTGNVSLLAINGAVTDAGDTGTDVVASGLRIEVAAGAGTLADALEVNVDLISAHTNLGAIVISESDNLVVGAVSVITRVITADGSSLTISDALQNGIEVEGNGDVRVSARELQLGDVIAGGGSVEIAATVLTQTGTITTNGLGEVVVDVTAGDFGLGNITTAAGSIRLTVAGGVTDQLADESPNIISGGNLTITATEGIGSTDDINIAVAGVEANNVGSGNVQLREVDGLVVFGTLNNVGGGNINLQVDAGDLTINDAVAVTGAGDLDVHAAGVMTINAAVSASAGHLVLTGGTIMNQGAVSTGTGDVVIEAASAATLSAGGTVHSDAGDIRVAAGNLIIDAAVDAAVGNISVIAAVNVVQTPAGPITAAGTIDVEAGQRVLMSDGALVSTSGASIRVAGGLGVRVGGIDAGDGQVSVVSAAGDITDSGDLHIDITAGALRLEAAGSIGALALTDAIETDVDQIAASSAGGDINLYNLGDIVVNAVGVTVNRVVGVDSLDPIVDGLLAGLTTNGSGSIVLVTENGTITINGQPADLPNTDRPTGSDADAVSGTGVVTEGGNILLLAGGAGQDIVLNVDITSTTGNVTLMATDSLIQNAGADISTSIGSIDIEATNGSVIMAGDSVTTNTAGNISIRANEDIVLGGVEASGGGISLETQLGDIIDGGDEHTDLSADRLLIVAGNDIGGSGALDTDVGTVSAVSGGGDIRLSESGDIIVDQVVVAINRVSGDGTSDSVATNNRDIRTEGAGTVEIDAGGAVMIAEDATDATGILTGGGDITIDARTATFDAGITSESGTIRLTTQEGVELGAAGDLQTGSAGEVSIIVVAGTVVMSDGATVQTDAGTIAIDASGDITVGLLESGSGAVTIETGGAVVDGTADEGANVVTAGTLVVESDNGVGSIDDIDMSVGNVEINNTNSGDVRIDNAGSVAVTGDGLVNAGGGINVNVSGGNLVVDAPVTVTGGSSIEIAGSDTVVISGDVSSDAGSVSVSGNNIVQSGNVTTASGDVNYTANESILMQDSALVRTGSGATTLTAGNDISLTTIHSDSGSVLVNARTGSIFDNTEDEMSNVVTGGMLTLIAKIEVGEERPGGDIDIDAGVLNFLAFNANNIAVEFADGHEIKGSAENLYFITSKRDYEPHLEEAVTRREIPELTEHDIVISGYTLAELIEAASVQIFLGPQSLRLMPMGSELGQYSQQLLLRMHPLVSGSTFAESFNEMLAEAIADTTWYEE